MRIVKIPKRKGFRTIAVPSKFRKQLLRAYLLDINRICLKKCDKDIVFGFLPGSNVVVNASRHISYKYTLSFDLSNFFDTITIDHVKEYLNEDQIKNVFPPGKVDGIQYFRTWQGLPTSPSIANLAAIKMDKDIKDYLGTYYRNGLEKYYSLEGKSYYVNNPLIEDTVTYTRYADDLTFSFNDYKWYNVLLDKIPLIIDSNKFKINERKTRLQDSRFGRREVTGIFVDSAIHTNYVFKHKFRAAKYNHEHYRKNTNSVVGLTQWSLLKMPHPPIDKQINNLQGVVNLNYSRLIIEKHKKPLDLLKISILENKLKKYQNKLDMIKSSKGRKETKAMIRQVLGNKNDIETKDLKEISNIEDTNFRIVDIKSAIDFKS